LLGVSESTVRRLFINLEKSGRAVRTYGGVSILDPNAGNYVFERLVKSQPAEKKSIGAAASQYVTRGEVVYIDCGTTMFSLCLELTKRAKRKELADVQIFTNSLANLEVLCPFFKVTLIGGAYRPNRKDFAGFFAEKMLSNILNFSKCFMGADGFTKATEFCTTDFDSARISQVIVSISDQVFMLCDSTKFGKAALVNCMNIENINCLVTDQNIPQEYIDYFKEQSLQVIIV